MRILSVLFLLTLPAAALAQGQLLFNTHVTTANPPVNAPVVLLTDATKGPGTLTGVDAATAELFLISLNGIPQNISLIKTTFRTDAGNKYVNGPVVDVPGSQPNDTATLVFRAWQTSLGSWEASREACIGNSSTPFTITLGGVTSTPALLTGITGFTYSDCPEPSTDAVLVAGAILLFVLRRRNRSA